MTRPNILFAFADDWGRYASAYQGLEGERSLNALLDTPHFDRVAREGALFANAYVPAPSCTPCRSSLLSGSYFWQTGLGAILAGAVETVENRQVGRIRFSVGESARVRELIIAFASEGIHAEEVAAQ